MLGVVGKLNGLVRAPGPPGELKSKLVDGIAMYLSEDGSQWSPFAACKCSAVAQSPLFVLYPATCEDANLVTPFIAMKVMFTS